MQRSETLTRWHKWLVSVTAVYRAIRGITILDLGDPLHIVIGAQRCNNVGALAPTMVKRYPAFAAPLGAAIHK